MPMNQEPECATLLEHDHLDRKGGVLVAVGILIPFSTYLSNTRLEDSNHGIIRGAR